MKVLELFKTKFDIIESYNTRQDLKWLERGDFDSANFEVEEEKYQLRLYQRELRLPTRIVDIHEYSFVRFIKNHAGRLVPTVAQTESKYPSRVLGIVYNGIMDRIHVERPTYVVVSAKITNDRGNQSVLKKRIRIYGAVAQQISSHGVYDLITPDPLKSRHAYNHVLKLHSDNVTKDEYDAINKMMVL